MVNNKIGIIGLGYVGLPLSIVMAKSGQTVIGVDIDSEHVRELKIGNSKIEGVDLGLLKSLHSKERLIFVNDFSRISECDTIILTVPTPLNENDEIDLSNLKSAAKMVARFVSSKTLIINESTSFPGTLRDVIAPIFAENSSEILSLEFACSPERVDPGNSQYTFENTPRIVSGLTAKAATRAKMVYEKFVNDVQIVDTPEIAELSKIIENSYRLLNISFVNELKQYCKVKNIDLSQAIRAAASKPYGFQAFYPSAGVGGHCIPVDPIYLLEDAKSSGINLLTLAAAQSANRNLPKQVLKICEEILGQLPGKKILVEGIAYKSNISDIRESPGIAIFSALESKGVEVHWRDPMVRSWKQPSVVSPSSNFDLIIVCMVHDNSRLQDYYSINNPVLDLTHKLKKQANIIYF